MRNRPFALALLTSALLARPTLGQAIKRSCAGGQTLPCFTGQSVENVQDFGVSLHHHLLWHAKNLSGSDELALSWSSDPNELALRYPMLGHTEVCSCGQFPCNWLQQNLSCSPSHDEVDEYGLVVWRTVHDAPVLRSFRTIDGVPCTSRVFAHLRNSGQSLYWDLTADPEIFVVFTELGPGDDQVFEGYGGGDIPAGDFLCAGAGRAPFSRVSPSSIAIGQVISGGALFIRDNEVEVKVDGHTVWDRGDGQPHLFLGLLPDASGPRMLPLEGGPPLPPYDHCPDSPCQSLAAGTLSNLILEGRNEVSGSLTVNSLHLKSEALLWVNGNLTVRGGIPPSRGSIFVNGDVVVRGLVTLESPEGLAAIQAQGNVYLCGVKGAYASGPCAAGSPGQLSNLTFGTDLAGWGAEGSVTSTFTTIDSASSPSSGSAYVTSPGTFPGDGTRPARAVESLPGPSAPRPPHKLRGARPTGGGGPPLLGGSATGHGIDQPCIAVTPGQAYDVSVKVRIPAGQPNTGRGRATVTWFNDAVCFSRAGTSQAPAVSPPNGAWQMTSVASVIAPPGAQRAILGLTVEKDDPEQDFVAQFDDASFAPAAVPYGNLNGDVAIDVFDLVTMSNHIVGNAPQGAPPFLAPLAAADVNRSGLVDVFDLVVLAGFIVGNVPSLPV